MQLSDTQVKFLQTMTARAVMAGQVDEFLSNLELRVREAWLAHIRAVAQVTRDEKPMDDDAWQWHTGNGGAVSLVYVVMKVLDDDELMTTTSS